MNICTIIARNYVAHARVLAQSFKQVHPEGTCTVLVIDDPSGYIDAAEEPFELMTIDQIGLRAPERMAASYDVMELSTAVKPWLLRTLLDRPEIDSVAYLDPDIRVFGSLAEIDRRAREHNIVLTPHFTTPLPRDDLKPAEEDILIAGTYNLGFIALGESETAHQLLDWWSERLEHHCLNNPEEGRFVDQRWIDLAPGIWPGIEIFRDASFNIAYWNLATRKLEIDGDGYRVDGEPLHFFHFSGFDPRHPRELSKHQNRIEVGADPALIRICREYADELLAAGFEQAVGWPYGWDEMANGIRLDGPARQVYRDAVEANAIEESPFREPGAQRLVSYMTRSEGGNGQPAVGRYAQAVWDTRPDFRAIWPSIEGENGPDFVRWLHETAGDTGVATELLPPPSPAPNGAAPAPLPGPTPRRPLPPPGFNVVGYISSARGVGEVARQVHSALRAGNVPTTTVDTPAEPELIPKNLGALTEADHPYDFNLICVNADMLPAVATGLGEGFFAGRHSAGLWFWEVTTFPEMWLGSFNYVDEVWVASEYIARALRPLAPIPVQTVRVPVIPGKAAVMSRAELGMPDGFCFLFAFDYRSVFRRKNPLGLVEAFCAAFEPGEGPSLAIKSIYGDDFPAERAQLEAAVRDRPEIHLLEEKVPLEEKNAMIAACDCYVSLHRSEGLGLTMAEAMYFGRPVIATAYSGNLDFMTAGNGYLVPHTMAPIGDEAPPYPPEGEWAEPDLAQAAQLMREVYENPKQAAERGRRAAADIRRSHSLEAARQSIQARAADGRLQHLVGELLHPDADRHAEGLTGHEQLDHLLGFGYGPPDAGSGRLAAEAKRAYRRALRPYAAHQQRINESVSAALGDVDESLKDVREAVARGARVEQNINDRLVAAADGLRMLGDELEQARGQLAKADELVWAAGAEPYMADDRLGRREHPILGETIGFRSEEVGEHGYRGFEDVFRGSEEMIRDRQRVYLDLVADRVPVLDAGCGRGEFLDLLAERGIEAVGVDLDPDMVERCREKGHANVEQGDILERLEEAEPGSLGAIFSAQVIEHLGYETLCRFLELALSRLRPGGLLIAETVNPHSAAALKAFWVDPTHAHPLFPETMLALCAQAGYAAGDVFAPLGGGEWETDRTRVGEYAVVATTPAAEA